MTPPPNDGTVFLRAPVADIERWKAAAEADGRTLSNWIRLTLNASLPKPKKGR